MTHQRRRDRYLPGVARSLARFGLAAALTFAAICSIAARPVAAQAPAAFYSPVTGQTLAEPFLTAWATGGAFATFGNPVTRPVPIGSTTAQFFEFGALGVPTKQASTKTAKVSRLPVGAMLLAALPGQDRLVAGRRPGGTWQSELIANETAGSRDVAAGIEIDGRFKGYYDEHGGEQTFGEALTPAYLTAGNLVQWFQNGRLQILGGQTTVGVAPIGYELAVRLGLRSGRQQRGTLPVLDAARFHPYKGDGTVPDETGPFTPTQIMIPSIGVEAKIEQVQIVKGVMGTPADAWNVGWYPQISSPGEWTNVVMAGHLDWWGIGPTVFYNLGQVKRGDKVYLVDAAGKGATYQVMTSYAVDANAAAGPIVEDAGIEMLTLITCGGNFDGSEYNSRQIVRAKRI
jgi:LPXTG-site transpeptidase (sortase) family protein